MRRIRRFIGVMTSLLVLALPPGLATPAAENPPGRSSAAASSGAKTTDARQIDWDVLLPEDERDQPDEGPPPPIHDYLGEGGMAAMQVGSVEVNKQLDGMTVRLPGFVVPLELTTDGRVREFFLVPYVGACIHVPPPPPNQIVYVSFDSGMQLGSIYSAVWITGKLHTRAKRSRFGIAAYSLDAVKAEAYEYVRPEKP